MSVICDINYSEEKFESKYKYDENWGFKSKWGKWRSWEFQRKPTARFFVYVWEKATCLEDVLDTLRYWNEKENEEGVEHVLTTKKLAHLKSRATTYREHHSVPLKELGSIPECLVSERPDKWKELSKYVEELKNS